MQEENGSLGKQVIVVLEVCPHGRYTLWSHTTYWKMPWAPTSVPDATLSPTYDTDDFSLPSTPSTITSVGYIFPIIDGVWTTVFVPLLLLAWVKSNICPAVFCALSSLKALKSRPMKEEWTISGLKANASHTPGILISVFHICSSLAVFTYFKGLEFVLHFLGGVDALVGVFVLSEERGIIF